MFQGAYTHRAKPFQRSGRFFHVMSDDESLAGWYFHTREGNNYGPYLTLDEARHHCDLFIKKCIEARDAGGRGTHQHVHSQM